MDILRRRWPLALCGVLAILAIAVLLTRQGTTPQQFASQASPAVRTSPPVIPGAVPTEASTSPNDNTQLPETAAEKSTDPQLTVERVRSFEESLRIRERLRVRALPQWEDAGGAHYPFIIIPPSESELQEMRALAQSEFEDFGDAEQQKINAERNAILKQWTDFKDNLRFVDIIVPPIDTASLRVIQTDIEGEEKLKSFSESNPNKVIALGRNMEILTIINSEVGWRYSHLLHTVAE
jgi:hypothetical protein